MGGAPRAGFARPICQVPICHLTGFGKDELDGRLVEGRDRLNTEDRFISRMPDVALIASTLTLVETTLYAVAVAVYTLLVQRGRLSPWDRLLVELLGQPGLEEVASKFVDMAYRRLYVIWISFVYFLALVGGFWSMATQDLTGAA